MKRYEFTGETKEIYGRKLYQIRAIAAFGLVAAGSVGGWIAGDKCLPQDGTGWAYPLATVFGGVILGGVILGGEIRGGVIWGGEIRGGEIRDGYLPLQIQGSRAFVNIPDGKMILIGCQEHSPEFWLEKYKEIGGTHGYSEAECEEYLDYIKLAAKHIAAAKAKNEG